jgi:hypothetical protein
MTAAPSRVVRIGCAGLPAGTGHAAYFRRLPLLEVDATEPPREAVLRRWRAAAPAGCGFTVRAQATPPAPAWPGVLAAAGCTMREVIRFQTFLTGAEYIESFMQARREVFPGYFPDGGYPPNTLLVVSRLVRPELLVEIEAMAIKGARPGAAVKAKAGTPKGRRVRRRR